MLFSSSVSIFIPTLNAQIYLREILSVLTKVVATPSNIIIVDSSSTDKTVEILDQFNVQVHSINRHEFNHGKTRNLCLKLCNTEFIVFLTQDALPRNVEFLDRLLMPFEDDLVVATYARQLPRLGSKLLEQLDRTIKYPENDIVQSKETILELGSRAYFLSNSCAAYRMSVFRELGGFPENEIMGEDAIFAQKSISKGYKIVYTSKAEVYHSHNYTFTEQFKRYFDTGVYRAQALQLSNTFEAKGDVNQGSSYARSILSKLIEQKQYPLIPEFVLSLGFSFLGYSLGKRYQLLPKWLRKKLSMHSFYWQ